MRRPISVSLVTLVFCIAGADADVPVSIDKLPKSVAKAVKAKYSKLTPVAAAKQTVDGDSFYVVTLKDDMQSLQAWFTPRGKLTETSRKVDIKNVSKLVDLAIRKNYPGAKSHDARERTVDPSKTGKRYFIVTLTTTANKKLEVTFDPRGSVLEEKELISPKQDEKSKQPIEPPASSR